MLLVIMEIISNNLFIAVDFGWLVLTMPRNTKGGKCLILWIIDLHCKDTKLPSVCQGHRQLTYNPSLHEGYYIR